LKSVKLQLILLEGQKESVLVITTIIVKFWWHSG